MVQEAGYRDQRRRISQQQTQDRKLHLPNDKPGGRVSEENSRTKKPRGKRVYSICWLIGTACKHCSVPKACLPVYTLLIRMEEYMGSFNTRASLRWHDTLVHSGLNMWQACLTHVAFVLQIMFILSLHLCGSNRCTMRATRSRWPNSLGKTANLPSASVWLVWFFHPSCSGSIIPRWSIPCECY